MLNIYIPSDLNHKIDKKRLFILVRPFYSENGWISDNAQLEQWGIGDGINLVSRASEADAVLLPYSINHYIINDLSDYLIKYNTLCEKNNIKAFGYIAGDFGQSFPEFNNIIYFRMGGFKSQLNERNIGLPAALSDHHLRLFGSDEISIRKKNKKPVIGYCGYSNRSQIIRAKDSLIYLLENIRRLINDPRRKDYEIIFPSGYYRSQILCDLEKYDTIVTNFIHRKKYRAGAISEFQRKTTTLEYYNNIRESDYIVCLRGRGNFSIRLYETLMMGRIPIFIDTDCLLPFPNHIDWKNHVVWIDWEERHSVSSIVAQFHERITDQEFEEIQIKNRNLWKEILSLNWIFKHLLEL